MTLQTDTYEGSPQGMNVAQPAQSLDDSMARYMQDILVDYPGLIRRRGPLRKVGTSVEFANKVSGIVQTLDSAGTLRVAVLHGDTSNGFLGMVSDSPYNGKTDIEVRRQGAFPLPTAPPANPFTLVDSKTALGGGAFVGLSDSYSIPSRQALIFWKGSRKAAYSTGTFSSTVNSTAVTGAGTTWVGNVEPGMFLFQNTTSPYDGYPSADVLKYIGTVKSVTNNTALVLERPALTTVAGGNYVLLSTRGIQQKVGKGRITTSTTAATVTGALTKFSDWGLNTSWALYRLADGAYIGTVASVQSNLGLTLSANAGFALANERYFAVKLDEDNDVSNLSGVANRMGWITNVYAEKQWYFNVGTEFKKTSRGYFSDSQDFEMVDPAEADGDFINIGTSRGSSSPVRAAVTAYNAQIVIKEDETYAIRGTTPTTFAVGKLIDDGTLSGMSAMPYGGGVVWAGRNGIYYYDGVQADNITQDRLGDFYKNLVRSFTPATYRMWAMVVREHYFLFIESAAPNVPVLKGLDSFTPSNICICINMPTRAISVMTNVNLRGSVILPADTGQNVWYVANGYPSTLSTETGFIDTATFNVGVGTDDGEAQGILGTYPPTMNSATTSGVAITVKKTQVAGPSFDVRNGLLRFDTSALPDGATITSAQLKLYVQSKSDSDARNLIGEYYANSNWPIDATDGVVTPGTTAFTQDITPLTAGVVNSITLTNPDANINKTGYTGFRLGIDGGSPAATNDVVFSAFEHPTNAHPQLVVTYIVTGGPPVGGTMVELDNATTYWTKVVLATDQWVPRVRVYLDGFGASASGSSKVRAGLYSNAASLPDQYLSHGDEITVQQGQAAGYVDVDLHDGIRAAAGTYWIAVQVEKSGFVRMARSAVTGGGATQVLAYALGPPDPAASTGVNFSYAVTTVGAATSTLKGYILNGADLFDTEDRDDYGCDANDPGPDFYYESKKFSAGDSLRKKLFKQLAVHYLSAAGNIRIDTVVGLNDLGKTSTSTFPSSSPTWDSIRVLYTSWSLLAGAYGVWNLVASSVMRTKRVKFLKRSTHLSFRLWQSSPLMTRVKLGPFQIGYKLQRPGRV